MIKRVLSISILIVLMVSICFRDSQFASAKTAKEVGNCNTESSKEVLYYEGTRLGICKMLYHMAGDPEVSITILESYNFTDLQNLTEYEKKAVAYALGQNIISGTGNGTFSPNRSISRAQAVLLLWADKSQPSPTTSVSPFTDITDTYYYTAVLWAAEQSDWIDLCAYGTLFYPDNIAELSLTQDTMWKVRIGGTPEDTPPEENEITWKFDPSTGDLVIQGKGPMEDYDRFCAPWDQYRKEIKSVSLSYRIKSIGNNSFYGCVSLASISIPGGLTAIGEAAFSGCTALSTVSIPESVTIIGDSAFSDCTSLSTVAIPGSVIEIGDSALSNCTSLASATIFEGVTSIGKTAFYGCTSLSEVTIPKSLTTIEEAAFSGCTALTTVLIPENVSAIGDDAFAGCNNLLTVVVLPKNCTFGSSPNLLGIPGKTTVKSYVDSTSLPYSILNGYSFLDIQTVDGTDTLTCPSCNGSGMSSPHWVTCSKCNGTGITTKRWCNTCGSKYILLVNLNGRPPFYMCIECGSTNIGESTETCSTCHGQGGSNQQTPCITCYGEGYIQHTHSYESSAIRPTCTMCGYTSYTCTNNNCRKHYTTDYELPLGHIFINGVCTRCGAQGQQNYIFEDINEADFFYYPVMWAVSHNPIITAGIDATHFGPNNDCTREQIVTFLWAANGKPEPDGTGKAFTDVASTAWYYKPVMWAVQHEITSGVSGGVFGVGQPCTRAQAMTFLWAAKGKPEPESTVSPFTDVSSGDWFCKPILWAAENGVTAGIGDGLFGVNNTCTRAQIITFLYKVYGAG